MPLSFGWRFKWTQVLIWVSKNNHENPDMSTNTKKMTVYSALFLNYFIYPSTLMTEFCEERAIPYSSINIFSYCWKIFLQKVLKNSKKHLCCIVVKCNDCWTLYCLLSWQVKDFPLPERLPQQNLRHSPFSSVNFQESTFVTLFLKIPCERNDK